ncbi:hypothetical protein AB0C02_29280 [Micromonospora sp. NPDC048999]|uniref:hypothetical protein n=1 Tax=Micromonospora sp. NPDC048999 TaxID=3155391 RepID=UPI0033C504EE
MTDANLPDQIRTLHTETIAAIEQRQTLADAARSALLAALENRLICRSGCEDALAAWGLKPLPEQWTVSADMQLSYTRSHRDLGEAREQARRDVPDELRLLPVVVAVYPTHVIDVAPAPDDNEQSESQRYHITVQVTLHMSVTATHEADALDDARTTLECCLPELADAGITLTDPTWQATEGTDDASYDDAESHAAPAAGLAQLTDLAQDLTAATAARDAAVHALADLRRKIRARAIGALIDDEIGGIYQHTSERVGRFLVDLGLDGLPRAHHVTVVADLTLPVNAGTVQQACDAAQDAMRAVADIGPDEARPWIACGRTIPEDATVDQNAWRVPWRHEYEMWLRGHATADDAKAAAEALVRADLTRALAGTAHHLATVTASIEGVGVDLFLDPDSD